MRDHLYAKKKVCPAVENDIELSEEIKQYILDNRIYRIPKKEDPKKTIQNIITYNNTMNNYIGSMDTLEKLQKYHQYNKAHLIGFNTHVQDHLQDRVQTLQNSDILYDENAQLSKDDILEIVDDVSKAASKQMKEFNLMYDDKVKKIRCYDDGEWTDYFVPKGVKLVIKAIQDYYLTAYEFSLIRKIQTARPHEKQRAEELLQEYYKFIASFDVDPMVKDKKDRDILYERFTSEWSNCRSQSAVVAEKFTELYWKIRDNLTKKETDAIRKHVFDILKQNTRHNIEKLNKNVVNLFNIDESFKELILKKGVDEKSSDEDVDDWGLDLDSD